MKTCFALPPRLFRPTIRCALQDNYLTRLREMQRAVQARRTDLRARGIRGKADEEDSRLAGILDSTINEPLPVDAPKKKAIKRGRPRKAAVIEAKEDFQRPEEIPDGEPVRGRVIHRVDGNLPFSKREEPIGFTLRECELGTLAELTRDSFTRRDGTLPWKRIFAMHAEQKSTVTEEARDVEDNVSFEKMEKTILDAMNKAQQIAVLMDPSKACLVLAGPGSGKTRVLTHRFAYLVKQYQISPYKILAVTFTNKAATEMKERVVRLLVGDKDEQVRQQVARKMAVGTFHAICARFLRKYGEEIGIPREFDICDTPDSRSVITKILKDVSNAKTVDSATVGQTRAMISKIKNITEDGMLRMKPHTYRKFSDLRDVYDAKLRSMKLLDFDDILLETRRLLQECPHILGELQDRFDNVLVDEWQDTNEVQFDIVSLLAGKRRNLFVVGDADQSIYKFRGADSGNLQRFFATFPDAEEITLERNYRSSGCIVQAAQSVINEDRKRPIKRMTTANEFGNKVVVQQTSGCKGEAIFVVSELKMLSTSGQLVRYSDSAVLYRTNAQSRQLEEAFLFANIPYKLQSGVRFYERAEIKDIVGYVKLIANTEDDNSFRRIFNTPPRKMGKRTLETVEDYAEKENVSLLTAVARMMETCRDTGEMFSLRPLTMKYLSEFYNLLYSFRKRARSLSSEGAAALKSDAENSDSHFQNVGDLIALIVEEIGYRDFLDNRKDNDPGSEEKRLQRQANVDELIESASRHKDVREFLENVALLLNSDQKDNNSDQGAVSLMTLHGAKGLEFDAVFIVGAEEGVIPTIRTDENSMSERIDEERRLLYVGMTRAKKLLYITWRTTKYIINGRQVMQSPKSAVPSRFLDAIPEELAIRARVSKTKQ